MRKENIISLEDRVPKFKKTRRRKANRILIVLLILFFSLISIVIYFQSSYSHVGEISIKGNEYYDSQAIILQSELSRDVNIWTIRKADIINRVKKLTKVKSAQVSYKFPNEIIIQIEELKTIAYILAEGKFYPLLEDGTVFKDEEISQLDADRLVLFNFEDGQALKDLVAELNKLPDEIINAISEIHHLPTEINRHHLTLFMNDGFEVRATIRDFAEKMVHYPAIVGQLDPTKKGMIDLEVGSFFKEYNTFQEEEDVQNDEEG